MFNKNYTDAKKILKIENHRFWVKIEYTLIWELMENICVHILNDYFKSELKS
jgi:hypothetical protein